MVVEGGVRPGPGSSLSGSTVLSRVARIKCSLRAASLSSFVSGARQLALSGMSERVRGTREGGLSFPSFPPSSVEKDCRACLASAALSASCHCAPLPRIYLPVLFSCLPGS